MNFTTFLNEEYGVSSGSIIFDALDYVGMTQEPIRQLKENGKSLIYKENGHPVKGILIFETGPRSKNGYSERDAIINYKTLVHSFETLGGKVVNRWKFGSVDAILDFKTFTVTVRLLSLNSELSGDGVERKYIVIKTT